MKHESYQYVGSQEITDGLDLTIGGSVMVDLADVRKWILDRSEEWVNSTITATFVISEEEEFIINGRHSEHVMCAMGKPVLSAGEVSFQMEGKDLFISDITNQSTGYCPKPDSWTIVQVVLDRIGIIHPDYFTRAYHFRYCEMCQSINLIKDEVYDCILCGAPLDKEWNVDKKKMQG